MKISIITINYNHADGLRNTAESVVSQTYSNYEWIIIDGGSIDGSVDVIKEYEKYVTFWCSEKDSGIYDAMNKGTKHATGDYIINMNSGDCFYAPDVLQQFVNLNAKEDLVIGGNHLYDERGKFVTWKIDPHLTMMSFYRAMLPHQSTFIKREFAVANPYNTEYRIVSDLKFYVDSIFFKKCTTKFFDYIVCNQEAGGISRTARILNVQERQTLFANILPTYILDDYKRFNGVPNELAGICSELKFNTNCLRAITCFAKFIKKCLSVKQRFLK